jgi:hypothetical protein
VAIATAVFAFYPKKQQLALPQGECVLAVVNGAENHDIEFCTRLSWELSPVKKKLANVSRG